MAEPVEMPFRLWTRVCPEKHVLHEGAHWHNLANTVEPSMFGGRAKTAAPIEMSFEVFTRVVKRNHVLDGVQIVPRQGAIFRGKGMPEPVR